MDPVSIIVGALLAGAAAATQEVTGQAIKDAYSGLKQLITSRFGKDADVASAVEQLEAKPDSKARQGVVQEEVAGSGLAEDAAIVEQAGRLLELLKQAGGLTGAQYTAMVSGGGAVAQGPGAVAAGEGGLAIGGNVTGGVHLGGAKPKREPEDADER